MLGSIWYNNEYININDSSQKAIHDGRTCTQTHIVPIRQDMYRYPYSSYKAIHVPLPI